MGSVGQLIPAPVLPSPARRKPEAEEVQVYLKAGVDGERMGACPFCQRVLMVLSIKAQHQLLRYKVTYTSSAKPPPEFKALGLKHLPAIVHEDDGFDSIDDILQYLDNKFPGGGLKYNNSIADLATKDFFSKFCFYIKAVNKQDASKLNQAMQCLNHFLETNNNPPVATCNGNSVQNGIGHKLEDEENTQSMMQYLCGSQLTHLDCEVLPKLQHLRVAAKSLKDYEIPTNLKGIWRYLHNAYTHPVFMATCPCDQEIILHWHDRPEMPPLSHKKHSLIAKENPKFSFDVPVHASFVTILDDENE